MGLFFSYIKRYKKITAITLAVAFLGQIFSLLDTQIFRLIVDNYATKVDQFQPRDFIFGVAMLLLAGVFITLLSRIFVNLEVYLVNSLMQRVSTQLYNETVAHIFSLPYEIFVDERSGSVLRRLEKARVDTQNIIKAIFTVLFIPLVSIIFVTSYAFYVHIYIGLAFLLIIPIMTSFTFFISRGIRRAQKEIVAKTSDLAGSTTETIRNIELVKSLGLEKQEEKRLEDVNEVLLTLELRKVKLSRILFFIQGTLINVTRASVLFLMFYLMAMGHITLGEFLALMFYSFSLFAPLYEIGEVATVYQEAKGSLESLEDLRNKKPEPKPKDAVFIDTIKKIDIENVTVTYTGQNNMTLNDISLSAHKGQSIAFVGSSGAGKTTLLKIILGLLKPESGSLKVNDIESNRIDFESFRSHIGYVSQDSQLFAGTIKENLRFVKNDATEQECLEAIKKANCENILERGEMGLETIIGEGGIKLSGGEKQRLAIARALLRDPDILIFDEATSSLDSITEKAITKTIADISSDKSRIVIMVAHRLSTVLHADTIFVLSKGKIIEEGNHNELLSNGGLYEAMWKEQSNSSDII